MVQAFDVVVLNRLLSPVRRVIDQHVTADLKISKIIIRSDKALTVANSIMPVIEDEILNRNVKDE